MLRTVGEEGLRLLAEAGEGHNSQPQSRGFNGGRGVPSLSGAVAAGRGGRRFRVLVMPLLLARRSVVAPYGR